ncbi:hypothetical protein ACFV1B_07905 [Streptomyces sp. NPDC059637]|uniref:hypothetical protein n=1 Tax=Streptomyces sp. NPDC059637 TaxID=3347752 RepID=UPI0036C01AEE
MSTKSTTTTPDPETGDLELPAQETTGEDGIKPMDWHATGSDIKPADWHATDETP